MTSIDNGIVATTSVMEIRGGIDEALMLAHEARIKKDEEIARRKADEERQKKAAEDAKLREQYNINHPNLCKHLYASYWNQNPYYGDSRHCNVYFYEWSDINSEPKKFVNHRGILDWLDNCGLFMDSEMYGKLIPLREAYITCKPNSSELIMANSYDELKRLFEFF